MKVLRALLLPFLFSLGSSLCQADIVWKGTQSAGWNARLNWDLGRVPNATEFLIFDAGSTRRVMTNDRPVNTTFTRLVFKAAGYELSGNGLSLPTGTGIEVVSSATEVVNPVVSTPLTVTLPQVFFVGNAITPPPPGALALPDPLLTLTGPLTLQTTESIGQKLTFRGGRVTVTGDITGSTADLEFVGSGLKTIRNATVFRTSIGSNSTLVVTGRLQAALTQISGQLRGTGVIDGRVEANPISRVNPGVGQFGRLTFEDQVVVSSPTFEFDLGQPTTAGITYDQLVLQRGVETEQDSRGILSAILRLVRVSTNQAIGHRYTLIEVEAPFRIFGFDMKVLTESLNFPELLQEGTRVKYGPSLLEFSLVGGDGNDVTATVVDLPPQLNDVPNQSLLEGGSLTVPLTVSDPATPLSSLALSASANVEGTSLRLSGSGAARSLVVQPPQNFNGELRVTVTVNDGNFSAQKSFTVTVQPVNDPPSFTARNAFFVKDGGTQTIFPWVSSVTDGDGDQGGQLVAFEVVSNSNPALFAEQPKVGDDGRLVATPAPGLEGTATIQVRPVDNGGTSQGGNPIGQTRSFVLTVAASFERNPNRTWRGLLAANGWFLAANWTPTVVPTSSDLVAFPANAVNKQVLIPQAAEVSGVRFGASGYVFETAARLKVGFEGIEVAPFCVVQPGSQLALGQNQTWTLREGSELNFSTDFQSTTTLEVVPGVNALDIVMEDDSTLVWPNSVGVDVVQVFGGGTSRQEENILGSFYVGPIFASKLLFDRNSTHVFQGRAGAALECGEAVFFKGVTWRGVNVRRGEVMAGGRLEGGGQFDDPVKLLVDGNANAAEVALELGVPVSSPRLRILESLALNGARLELVPGAGMVTDLGTVFTLVEAAPGAVVTGTFAGLPEQAEITLAGVQLVISYTGGDGNDVTAKVVGATPALSALEDQSVDEGSGAINQTFTFTNASSPVFSFASSDPTIVPVSNLTVVGSGSSSRQLRVTPLAEANGTTTITLTVSNGQESASQAFEFTVQPVNDPPVFEVGPNLTVSRAAGSQGLADWVASLSVGPANEEGQSVSFEVLSIDRPDLFLVPPEVDLLGRLTFAPNPASAAGTAEIVLRVRDSGGTERGGIDTSLPQRFTITVTAANSPPSFVAAGDVSALAGQVIAQAWATQIRPGVAVDEAGQNVVFLTETTSPELFLNPPSVSPEGVLTATLLPTALGSAQVFVRAQDDGGTDNGGRDVSAVVSFSIRTANVLNANGTFLGLAESPEGLAPAHARTGFLNLRILKPGVFSGRLTLGGRTHALKGTFGNGGMAIFGRSGNLLSLPRAGLPALQLSLSIDAVSGNSKVTGVVLEAGLPFAVIEAERALYDAKKNPMLAWIVDGQGNQGRFTSVLPALPAPNEGLEATRYPQGDGWADLSIGKDGKATLKGRLADNTPFSSTSFLTAENRVVFYAALYRGQGSISGRARYQNQGASDANGSQWRWYKPAPLQPRAGELYPFGWPEGILVDFEASRFVAKAQPYLGALSAADADGNVVLRVDGLAPKAANLSPTNRIQLLAFPDPDLLSSTLVSSTGRWTGAFRHPLDLQRKTFSGVVLQKSNRAAGFYLGPQGSARVAFEVTP